MTDIVNMQRRPGRAASAERGEERISLQFPHMDPDPAHQLPHLEALEHCRVGGAADRINAW